METKRLNLDEESLKLAADILKGGGIVAIPTETVLPLVHLIKKRYQRFLPPKADLRIIRL